MERQYQGIIVFVSAVKLKCVNCSLAGTKRMVTNALWDIESLGSDTKAATLAL